MKNVVGIALCLLLAMTLACSPQESAPEPEPSSPEPAAAAEAAVIVDHIIVGTSDLEAGMEELEALTGVTAVMLLRPLKAKTSEKPSARSRNEA